MRGMSSLCSYDCLLENGYGEPGNGCSCGSDTSSTVSSASSYTCRDFYLNMNGTHSGSTLADKIRMREARLEKYIKDYAYDKTGESVYLHLEDSIRITHITRKGSITLAILWANVLQHPTNFPPESFPYTKLFDGPTGGDRLILKAEKIIFTVYMASGALKLEGPYIYDWFVRRFRALLDNYDGSFQKTWTFIPTAGMKVDSEVLGYRSTDPNTETEDYLLLKTPSHAVNTPLDKRMEEHADDYIAGLGNMNLDQPVFEGEELDKQLESLANGGLKNAMTYVHKLWRSLLNKWMSCSDTKLYIATPEIDVDRLRDIIDVCMCNQYKGQLEVLYTNFDCDASSGRNVENVKSVALETYDSKHRTYIEYRVLHKVMLPLSRVNARYIAGVREGGEAQVLTTSASFHGKSFVHDSLETVGFRTMSTDTFMQQYVEPVRSPVVASTY